MAYKSEHAVDLEAGALLGVTVHPADRSDSATIEETLEVAEGNLRGVRGTGAPETEEEDTEGSQMLEDSVSEAAADGQRGVVADKGHHKAVVLRRLKRRATAPTFPNVVRRADGGGRTKGDGTQPLRSTRTERE